MTDSGRGVKIVNVTENHEYQVDEKELEGILLKEDIKDLPVVVISVAGALRTGKSFLLNFFLRYLKSPLSARVDGSWLGEESQPLTGFSWRSGSKLDTKGIVLWSEPFIFTLPSGDKAAVLLMDTEGAFNSTSTVRDIDTIMALSILLSSVQIYNMSKELRNEDLQYLYGFSENGKLAKLDTKEKLQMLEFLVRDWQFPTEYEYGAEGGDKLLAQQLKDDPTVTKELGELRKNIRLNFDKVSCYLMPHPGFNVLKPSYKGEINEISPEFREHLSLLISSLLAPEKLQPKLINGQRVKAQELIMHLKSYVHTFNNRNKNVIPPGTIFTDTVEIKNFKPL